MTRPASALALPSLFDEAPAPVSAPTHSVTVRAHRRTIRGEPGPTGRQLRDAALDAHDADDSLGVAREYVRSKLAALYRARAVAWAHKPERIYVNADDVADILDAWADCPAEIRTRPGHWKGSLFRSGWTRCGSTVSARPHMHATRIENWRLAEVARG